MKNNEYTKTKGSLHGPGGIKCPCCCSYSRGEAKKAANRKMRRKSREEIWREAYEAEKAEKAKASAKDRERKMWNEHDPKVDRPFFL